MYSDIKILLPRFPFFFMAAGGAAAGGAAAGGAAAGGAAAGGAAAGGAAAGGAAAGGANKDEGSEEGTEVLGSAGGSVGKMTSPEGIMMFILGGTFDLIGLIPIVGDFSDIAAGIVFGLWTFTKEGGGKKIVKYLISLILMAIPIVSDIAPVVSVVGMLSGAKLPTSWIGYVYSTL